MTKQPWTMTCREVGAIGRLDAHCVTVFAHSRAEAFDAAYQKYGDTYEHFAMVCDAILRVEQGPDVSSGNTQ